MRLVLPYVPLRAAVAELGRVLKPGGAILVQTHAPRYYWKRLWRAFPRVKQMVYFAKPLLGGIVFALTGWQVGKETALGRAGMKRLFARQGVVCVWEGGFDSKPVMVFRGAASKAEIGKAESRNGCKGRLQTADRRL